MQKSVFNSHQWAFDRWSRRSRLGGRVSGSPTQKHPWSAGCTWKEDCYLFFTFYKILSSTQRRTPRPQSDDPRNSSNLQQRRIARQGAPADNGHTWWCRGIKLNWKNIQRKKPFPNHIQPWTVIPDSGCQWCCLVGVSVTHTMLQPNQTTPNTTPHHTRACQTMLHLTVGASEAVLVECLPPG